MNENPSVRVIVAAHKQYRMPEDEMYLPLEVGAALRKEHTGYQRDDAGENISRLNAGFCELTGLYWAWRNLKDDYIGLAHYRRHFRSPSAGRGDKWARVLKRRELEIGETRVFVPRARRYYIETLYSHYAHTHDARHLDLAREIIRERFPAYLDSCDRAYGRRSGYMFNMMIMDRDCLNAYCEWLFAILFEMQNRMGETALSAFDGRFYGRVSEILLNVWLEEQLRAGKLTRAQIRAIPYMHMEKERYLKKTGAFLRAKLFGRKYERSF